MKKHKLHCISESILADTITPVSFYLKIRDIFPNSILLESSDYHGVKGSYSFLCFQPLAEFMVHTDEIKVTFVGESEQVYPIENKMSIWEKLDMFLSSFEFSGASVPVNGVFGYMGYDAIEYFETIRLRESSDKSDEIPPIRYCFYKYIVAINHFQNSLQIIENLMEGEYSDIDRIKTLLRNRNFATYNFSPQGTETSNITDEQYKEMVSKGKQHCFRGDVFQIVLSRQFRQSFNGDEFNVYRALRSINPSPYLFYFDYGSYKIFGSSPEAQLEIQGNQATIYPIAGTIRRTGDDEHDKQLAEELSKDPKENAEHVMLVDLARNDLSRNARQVIVETYKEIQYFSHVLHMVSKVSGTLEPSTNRVKVLADSFPAGTLSGAPKYKAMELIDQYEFKNRGFYGGCLGYLGFNGDCNHAIMIRSFMSRNNLLFYQAGAGIVAASVEEKELAEVNNKLAALKKAIILATEL
jgi:anthranilate synthase component I